MKNDQIQKYLKNVIEKVKDTKSDLVFTKWGINDLMEERKTANDKFDELL